KTMSMVNVLWACDRDLGRARHVAKLFDVPHATTSLQDCSNVDVVLVAIPVGARRDVLEKIVAKKWHAFCEKPFAPTLRDHEWMVAEGRTGGIRLGIGLVRRHYDSTLTAKRLIATEAFGPIEQVIAGDGLWLRGSGRGGDYYQTSPQAS